MKAGKQVNQFNSEIKEYIAQITETITRVETELEKGFLPDEKIEKLNDNYRDLSKKSVQFIPESEDFRLTKPLKALRQPTRKDHEGKRGLKASEPDLLEHKQELEKVRDVKLREAEKLYQRYREEKGLEKIEPEIHIPSALDELDELKESKAETIHFHRDYLKDLRKIKNGEKDIEEIDYLIPENEELIQDQIEVSSERIYENWERIKKMEENVEKAFNQLRQEINQKPGIEIGIKYGLRPVESSVEGRSNQMNAISKYWNRLGNSVKKDLPEEYSQMITERADINV